MTDRPNILLLMSDEHRADITGYEGNPIIRTPFLDHLARTGVRFTNAYCPAPVCVPGRQCLMSGQHCFTNGVKSFWDDLPPGHMTFARALAREGYRTVCCGKLHHHGADQMQGWTHRPVGDLAVAPRYIESRNRSTFEQMERQAGTGKWSMEKEIKRAGIGTGPYQTADELATLGALRVIQEHFNSSMYDRPMSHQPLLLKVSLVQPHYPYFTDETKFNYYLNRVPIFIEPRAGATLTPKHAGVAVNVDPREIRRATAAYYGMIETVDAQFRRVCDALEQVGQNLDDWIIIYTSDHGEMLGEHGLWEKSCFYEAAVRVPLLIRCPSRFSPRVCSENVNLVDLFATICELSGSPIPPSLDSRSLLPLLHGDAGAWDNYTLSLDAGTRLMIKHDHLKYQHNGGEYPEILFDLETDPSERVNRMGDPRYQDAVQRFRAQRAALPGFTELSRTVAGAAPAGSSS